MVIIIECGICGGKYQVIPSKFDRPLCPSCGAEIPEKIRTSVKTLIEETKNRPNWKLLIEFGNVFDLDLTIKTK